MAQVYNRYSSAGSEYKGIRRPVSEHDNDAAVAITMTEAVYQSGLIFTLAMGTATNDIAFTLPAPVAGLEYKFIVSETAGSGVTLTITAPSAILNGVAHCLDANEVIAGTSFIFAATKAVLGTQVDMVSDGTLWYIQANCKCDAGDISTAA